jgi:hypothetical protein
MKNSRLSPVLAVLTWLTSLKVCVLPTPVSPSVSPHVPLLTVAVTVPAANVEACVRKYR